MKKYYFQESDENCYTIDYHLEYMKANGINEMKIFEAKMETGNGYYFCSEYGECGESGDGCGKDCCEYKPRNGKNGRCIHSKNTYEQTEKFIILISK